MTRCSIWDTSKIKRWLNAAQELLDTANAVVDMVNDTAIVRETNDKEKGKPTEREKDLYHEEHKGEPTEGEEIPSLSSKEKDLSGKEGRDRDREREGTGDSGQEES